MFVSRNALRVAFSGLWLGAMLSASPASACNFLQKMFGCEEQQAAPAPTLEQALPTERKAERRSAPVAIRKQEPIQPPEGAAVGSMAHFAADPTLRKGDIVVTRNGFKVFNGAAGVAGADKMQAFALIDTKNGVLAEMQSESRKSDWTDAVAPPKPVVEAPPEKPKKKAARKVTVAAAKPAVNTPN